MEFRQALTDVRTKSLKHVYDNGTVCDGAILEEFLERCSDDTELWQYLELKAILTVVPNLGNALLSGYHTDKGNGDADFGCLEAEILRIAKILEDRGIGCVSFAYFISCYLELFKDIYKDNELDKLGAERVEWLPPHSYDYCYGNLPLSEKTFGYGCYNPQKTDFVLDENGGLEKYNGISPCVVIPNTVTVLKADSFAGNKNLEAVFIPDSVLSIEERAFKNCEKLHTVILGSNIRVIGDSAFEKCIELTRISLDGVTSVGNRSFKDCCNLKNIGKPALKTVGDSAFSCCGRVEGLDGVISGIEVIGEKAFEGCDIEIVCLECSNTLGSYAFMNCSSLSAVFMGEQMSKWGKAPFMGCRNVAEVQIDSPAFTEATYTLFLDGDGNSDEWANQLVSVERFGLCKGEFAGCSALQKVTVKNCSRIPDRAFAECTSLSSVEFADGIEYVGDSAFEGCVAISEFKMDFIGNEVGAKAFKGCQGVPFAALFGKVEKVGAQAFAYTDLSCVDFVNKKNFRSVGAEAFIGAKLPDNISLDLVGCQLSGYALKGITQITRLSVDAVHGDTFDRLHQLFCDDETEFNDTVGIEYLSVNEAVKEGAFRGYSNLRLVKLSVADGRIPEALFEDCVNLEAVEIAGEVNCIESRAFKGCVSLEKLEMTCGDLTVGHEAFMGCRNICELVDIAKIVRFGDRSFENTDIRKLVLGDRVEYIGAGAFGCCEDIDEVVIPFVGCSPENQGGWSDYFGAIFGQTQFDGAAVQKIDFGGVAVNFYIPASVRCVTVKCKTLKKGCFTGWGNLTEIRLPDITRFTESVFSCDTPPRSVYLGHGLEEFSVDAFAGSCNSIRIYVDSECADFLSVGGSVLSKDRSILYYLCTEEELNDFLPDLRCLQPWSVWKTPECLTLDGDIRVMGNAVNGSKLNSVKLGEGCAVEHMAFFNCDGLKNIEICGCNCNGVFGLNENTVALEGLSISNCSVSTAIGGIFSNENTLTVEKLTLSAVDFCGRDSRIFNGITSVKTLNIGSKCQLPDGCIVSTAIDELNVSGYSGTVSYLFRKSCYVKTVTVSDTDIYAGEFRRMRIGTLTLDGIGNICAGAFADTVISKLILSNAESIESGVFEGADIGELVCKTEEYVVTNGVLYYGDKLIKCFDRSVTEFTVPEFVTCVCKSAFEDLVRLNRVIVTSSDVTFEPSAFKGCINLRTFELPEIANATFGELFDGACPINFIIYNGSSVKSKFFSQLPDLREVKLNDTEEIYDLAFEGDASLERVYGLDSVKMLGDAVFFNCGSLVSAEIGSECSRVGLGAFKGCVSLQRVSYPIDSYQVENGITAVDIFGEERDPKLAVEITGGDIPAGYFRDFSSGISVEHSPAHVGDEAFKNSGLHWIRLNRTESVGDRAFSGTVITDAALYNVKTVGEGAFEGCLQLKSVRLNDGIESIGDGWLDGVPLERLNGASNGKTYRTADDCLIFKNEDTAELIYVAPVRRSVSLVADPSVHSISADAFKGSNIEWLDIRGVETVAENAFADCRELKSIKLNALVAGEESVTMSYFLGDNRILEYVETVNGDTLADGCFEGFDKLEKAILPANVKTMGSRCFAGCENLREVQNLISLESVGELAFEGCRSLEALSLPFLGSDVNNAAPITYLFGASESARFRSVNISEGKIVARAFEGCSAMVDITLPKKLELIPDGCFKGCSSLKSINSLDGIVTVGAEAFFDCSSLETVELPLAEVIGGKAFGNCSELSVFRTTENIKTLGEFILYNCRNLQQLTVAFTDKVNTVGLLDVGGCDSVKTVTVLGGIMGRSAFSECDALETVEISDFISNIPANAFHNCTKLATVKANGVITLVGNGAFSDCTALENADFISGLEYIGESAFTNCKIGGELVLKEIKAIGHHAFSGTGFSRVELGDNIRVITGYCFEDCRSLESVVLGNGVDTVREGAFAECRMLGDIDISKIKLIGDNAFKNCISIPTVTVTAAERLGEYCFTGCTAVKEAIFGDRLTVIECGAFMGCTALAYMNMSCNLKTVGGHAFEATSMTDLELNAPDSLEYVGEYAFKDAESPIICVKKGQTKNWDKNWGQKCKKHGFLGLSRSVTVNEIR